MFRSHHGIRLNDLAWLPALAAIAGFSACSPAASSGGSQTGDARSVPTLTAALAGTGATTPAVPITGSTAGAPSVPVTQVSTPPVNNQVPMGGAAAPPPTAAMMAKPVVVDPADVAACDGMGTAPQASETVEVLKIRTGDMTVVPGGYKAPGGTVYACFWIDIDMPEKHHIIGWEGAVGGDRAVHHQQVSLAAKPFYLAQQGGLCGLPAVDYTWTGEKPTEWTPKLAGYPVGGPENGGKAHFLWQVHFESTTMYSGGFNVYVTKNLRKYDAGNFEQGDVAGINIPPMAASTHTATCTPDMTTQKLTQPIYVFASMQHAHLMIRHIKTDLTRNGQLVKNFGDQMVQGFAGFFDQQFKPQSPCVMIAPGDQLTTVCDYQNSTGAAVMGGEGLNQEMCTTFFQYFPRLPVTSNNFCGTIDSSGGFTAAKP
jgi:hypothetical protein